MAGDKCEVEALSVAASEKSKKASLEFGVHTTVCVCVLAPFRALYLHPVSAVETDPLTEHTFSVTSDQ